jgi:hypothetical protein
MMLQVVLPPPYIPSLVVADRWGFLTSMYRGRSSRFRPTAGALQVMLAIRGCFAGASSSGSNVRSPWWGWGIWHWGWEQDALLDAPQSSCSSSPRSRVMCHRIASSLDFIPKLGSRSLQYLKDQIWREEADLMACGKNSLGNAKEHISFFNIGNNRECT